MTHEQEELMEVLKGSRKVSIANLVLEQHQILDKLRRMAGRKPDKIDTAFIEKHQAKLEDTFRLISTWIVSAYPETDEEKLRKYLTPLDLLEHYDITVLVSKKIDKS